MSHETLNSHRSPGLSRDNKTHPRSALKYPSMTRALSAIKGLVAGALVCAGGAGLNVLAQESPTLAPNGRPWLEGDTNVFKPKVNGSLRRLSHQIAKHRWSIAEFARTNPVPRFNPPRGCEGVVPPQRMKEMWLELLNEYRSHHGLAKLTWGIPASTGLTEQNLADGALYQGRMYEALGTIDHHPDKFPNAPHYSCLTPGILKASEMSNLAAFLGVIHTSDSVAFPYGFLGLFLNDGDRPYPGHRFSLLDPYAAKASAGWTHVNYTTNTLSYWSGPVSFYESSETAAAVLAPIFGEETPHTLTDAEKNIVFPAAGMGIYTWSRSYVVFAPGWSTMSLQTRTYDVERRVPVVTVVDETTNRRLQGRIVTRRAETGSPNSFSLVWKLDPSENVWPSEGQPANIRFTISNLHPVGQPLSTPPVSITWRSTTVRYTDVELDVKKKDERSIEVSFEAAHLYDGWENSWFDLTLYQPWQLQTSDTPDFNKAQEQDESIA